MWNEDLLLPVSEINELLLSVLRTRAVAAQPQSQVPRLLAELCELWLALTEDGMKRLARCPYLLLDAGFTTPERWAPAVSPGTISFGAAAGAEAAGAEAGAPVDPETAAGPGYFGGWEGTAMVRHALVFARYLARSHRAQARMLLALRPECAELLASRSLRELEQLARSAPGWILPRWESQPLVWRQMLQAAIGGQADSLQRVQLRGLQLMAALW